MGSSSPLFNHICSFENLERSYRGARAGKRYREEILAFGANVEAELWCLKRALESGTYQHGAYRSFIVHDAKKRHIRSAPFRDRVVHHALFNVLEPLFEPGFIYDSYACRTGKGTHAAVRRLQAFLQSARDQSKAHGQDGTRYVLACDISKYFDTVQHAILLKLLRRRITDPSARHLLEIIVRSYNDDAGRGIPIGNLTSQLFANVYLNELDQFVKRTLGVQHYIRYMDDFVILGDSKQSLHRLKSVIRRYLRRELALELHPRKAQVFPADGGIDFLGYTVFERYRRLRPDTVRRFVKRSRKQARKAKHSAEHGAALYASAGSWAEYARFAQSWRLRRDIEARTGLPKRFLG